MADSSKRICLGEIATAHGVRGLVRVNFYGDNPGLLEKAGSLFTDERSEERLSLRLKGASGGALLAEVEGISDRTQAEKLRGKKLWIERDLLPAIKDSNTYYHADLIGLSVSDQADKKIGKIVAVQNFGAGDLIEIQPDGAESFYLPFTKDNIIQVDLQAGLVVVSIPAGLV